VGASVKEAYLTLLDLSVVLQMLSYLYLFLALFRVAFVASGTGLPACPGLFPQPARRGVFRVGVLRASAVSGLLMTVLGLAMAFVPTRQISSIWVFEAKMLITTALFVALARALFVYYSRRKTHAASLG